MSRAGLFAAIVYILPAAYVLIDESRHPTGGWVSLRSLLPALITFPISFPLEWMGMLPDLSKPETTACLVVACAMLIYHAAAKISKLLTSQVY